MPDVDIPEHNWCVDWLTRVLVSNINHKRAHRARLKEELRNIQHEIDFMTDELMRRLFWEDTNP